MPKIRRVRQKYHAPAPPYSPSPSSSSSLSQNDLTSLVSSSSPGLSLLSKASPVSSLSSPSPQQTLHGSSANSSGERRSEVERLIQEEKTRKVEEALDTSFTGLSKGQRRRLAKREAWLRKFDFVTYAEQARQRKEREERFLKKNETGEGSSLLNLQSVRQQLECIDTSSKLAHGDGATAGMRGGSAKLTRKKMHKLAEKEMKQFEAVWKYPAFQNDPFGALRLHLTNSLNLQKNLAKEGKSSAQEGGKGKGKGGDAKNKEKKQM
ncbi:hypothetical protein CSUI_010088 [Cystoisospora suis]|uniref:Uncharacterized protein n=1 Tax=Cystoisospora suis TaxID=483139 RepID=A0A2C6KHG6_9APIC|nr:hypothetical protein CSUI_010088 [Cystoisospora suis]